MSSDSKRRFFSRTFPQALLVGLVILVLTAIPATEKPAVELEAAKHDAPISTAPEQDASESTDAATSAPVDLAAVVANAEGAPVTAPEQPQVGLGGEPFDVSSPRKTTGLNLVKNGWEYDCMSCHNSFDTGWDLKKDRVEHKHIKMTHGMNEYCASCHHPKNKNAFVNYDGSEIAETNVVMLCAKCHGPTYRDWEGGIHGRLNGHWDVSQGRQTRLKCIQCHDPHSPQFQSMVPMAGPPKVGTRGDEFLFTLKPGIEPIQGETAHGHDDQHPKAEK